MSIYERGRHSCTNCEHASKHSQVRRHYNLHYGRWKFYRSCAWCGSCFTATVEEWNAENPMRNVIQEEATDG